MKFLLVCSAAFAAGISLADTNGVTDFDKLTLSDPVASFATPESNVTVAGEAYTYTDSKYTLEGDLDGAAALIVTPDTEAFKKKDIEKFTLNFNVGFADELPTTYTEAALGFAFKAANTAAYWDGEAWNEIALSTSVTEEATTEVIVEYDGRATQAKVRFTIAGVKSDWYEVGTIAANTIKAFGSGVVTSIAGTTHTITKEEIEIPQTDPTKKAIEVTILEDDVLKIEAAGGFNEPSAKILGMSNVEAFILTGKAGDDVVKPVAKIETKSTDNTAVNFKLDGVDVQTIKNGKVLFILEGSDNNSDWTQIGDPAETSTIAMPIEKAATYKFFHVKAVVAADPAETK